MYDIVIHTFQRDLLKSTDFQNLDWQKDPHMYIYSVCIWVREIYKLFFRTQLRSFSD